MYPKILAFDYKIKNVKTEDDVSLDYSDSKGKRPLSPSKSRHITLEQQHIMLSQIVEVKVPLIF